MCLILLALGVSRRFPVVLAANRDEFYARPSQRLAAWDGPDGILGGRDAQGGGTWMALSRQGRFAAVTNVRAAGVPRAGPRSRGGLVTDFLAGERSARAYLADVLHRRDEYGGFNLLLADASGWFVGGCLDPSPRRLTRGLYGLSNHRLDTPWPKVVHGRRGLASILANDDDGILPSLMTLLGDNRQAPDERLPTTGIGLERERVLSPLCIHSPDYGTRVSSVMIMNHDRVIDLVERPRATVDGHDDVRLRWALDHALASG